MPRASARTTSSRLLKVAASAATLALIATGLAAPASARQPLQKGFWGPTQRDGVSQFPIYQDLGVNIFQMQLLWNLAATERPTHPRDPADPRYRWPQEIDYAITEARRYGMRVLLMIIGSPRWANGGKSWNWAPRDPSDYADFAYAASRRYPSVRLWMVWGEPSKAANFQPLTPQHGSQTKLTKAQAAAPRRYARILDAAYAQLKRRSKRNVVVGGNTFSYGEILPVRWVENLRLRNGRRPRMDLYGHNPFTNRKPDLSNPPVGAGGIADFSDLRRFNRVVDRILGRHTRLFLSEFAEPTAPDSEFAWYVSPEQQASWITAGFKVARAVGAHTLGWIHLYDDPPAPDGSRVSHSGLLYHNGEKKPGYEAFKRE